MRRYSIGRATTNDIVLDNMTVSRSHAEIEDLGRGRYMLRDRESTYGTKILREGQWIEVIEVEVASDTLIRFGEYEVTLGEIVNLVDGEATHMPRRDQGDAAAAPPVQPHSERHPTPPPPAATPKAPKQRAPKAPRAPAPSGPGAPDRKMTMLILLGGGAAAIVLILIAIVLAIAGGGSGITIGGGIGGDGKADFVAACKGAKRSDAECSCSWDVMRDKLTASERGIFISIVRDRTNATKLVEMTRNMSAAERKAFFQKVSVVAREIQARCRKK